MFLNKLTTLENIAYGEALISTLKKPPKAAWEMVCKPKEEGGLGVLDLQKQNEALLMKNLDKFLNRRDIPRVTMVWENTIQMESCQATP